jgi:hypothetical protein
MSIIKPDGKDERKKLKAEPGINLYDCFLTTKQLIMITLSIAKYFYGQKCLGM